MKKIKQICIKDSLFSIIILSLFYSCGSLQTAKGINSGTIYMGVVDYKFYKNSPIDKSRGDRIMDASKSEFDYIVAYDENTYVEYTIEENHQEIKYFYDKQDKKLYEFSIPNDQGFYTILSSRKPRKSMLDSVVKIEETKNKRKIFGYSSDEIITFLPNQEDQTKYEKGYTFYITRDIPHISEVLERNKFMGGIGFPILTIRKGPHGEVHLGIKQVQKELEFADILTLNLDGFTFVEEDKFGRYRKY